MTTIATTLPGLATYAGVAGVSGHLGVEHFGKSSDLTEDGAFGDWLEGIFAPGLDRLDLADIDDGLSNAMAVGEYLGAYDARTKEWTLRGTWTGAENIWSAKTPAIGYGDISWDQFSSPHPQITMFCMGDASTRPVRNKVDRDVFRALCSMRDGKAVDVRQY